MHLPTTGTALEMSQSTFQYGGPSGTGPRETVIRPALTKAVNHRRAQPLLDRLLDLITGARPYNKAWGELFRLGERARTGPAYPSTKPNTMVRRSSSPSISSTSRGTSVGTDGRHHELGSSPGTRAISPDHHQQLDGVQLQGPWVVRRAPAGVAVPTPCPVAGGGDDCRQRFRYQSPVDHRRMPTQES